MPDAVRPWAEQLRALADATGLRSQAQLAAALHVGTATMSRYLAAERLPDRSTVDKLVELARHQHGPVDETALFGAYEVAEKYFADRRGRGRDTASANTQAEDVPQVHRTRASTLVKFGIAAVVAAAAVGVAIVGASGGDEPQSAQSQANTTCSGASCTGRNHNAQGCDNDARSLASRDDNATTIIEVMYSDTCQAAWAKAKGAPPRSLIKIMDADGDDKHALVKAAAGEAAPTPTRMLFAPVGTRLTACIITGAQRICTKTIEIAQQP